MKFLLIALMACAMTSALAFDAARTRNLVNTLAGDDFAGRRSGHPGGRKTEEFIAARFAEYGVDQGGVDGYYQDVPLLITEEQNAELTIMDHELGRIPFQLGVDFTVLTHSGTAGIVAPVVIAGHGYVRPEKHRDDYGDLDAANKIVVIVRGTPESPYDFQEDYSRNRTLAWAKAKGAAGVLFYQDAMPTNGAAIAADVYDPDLPLLYVGDRFLRLILDGTGYSVDTYKEAIKNAPQPLETGKRVWLNTKVRKLESRGARNVLGIVYGTDPVLKKEVVVVGGHWDHIGVNAKGIIYNGADDNASGTAIVMELARVIRQQPLKRTVLFALFTAEEDGLLGSEHFVRNPTVPFGNIVGMINLDCEGMGGGEVIMAGGDLLGKVWDRYVAALDSADRARVRFYREDGHGASDHASFMQAGCPVVAFWARGQHPFYHSYEDDARWISNDVLAAVGERAEHLIRFLGNTNGSSAFHADSLRLLARLATTVDFSGLTLSPSAKLSELSAVTAAWLPRDGATTTAEAVWRMSEFHHACDILDVDCGNIATSLDAYRRQRRCVFIGMDDGDLYYRAPAEIKTLIRQGLTVVRLAAGSAAAERNAQSEGIRCAQDESVFALVPFDFNTPTRIQRWGKHAIAVAPLHDFAAAPASVREGLLTSDALIVVEVTDSATVEQLRALHPGRARRAHLSFGALPPWRREEHARATIRSLYDAGFTRDEILLLTGGNLRRFFKK